MGSGASNLSTSSLDVFQESITKVAQQLRAKASNKAQQMVDIEQTINITIGSVDQCETNLLKQSACDTECSWESRGPLYQCQFSFPNKRLISDETNPENCDVMFGTYADALSYDGICDGTIPMNENEREDICFNRAARLACPSNPVIKVPDLFGKITGTGQFGYENDPTCNNNCSESTYMTYIDLGNGRRSYDYRRGSGPITNKPSGNYIEIDSSKIYDCNVQDPGGKNFRSGITLNSCQQGCAERYKCVPIGSRFVQGKVNCSGDNGGFCASNTATVNMGSEQLADSNIKAEMVTRITNDFQSEVIKTISQTNQGINFGQLNTSNEMTEITQLIKNSITNSIKASSTNEIKQESALKQSVNLVVNGILEGKAGCSISSPDYSKCDNIEDVDEKKACQETVQNDYNKDDEINKVCVPNSNSKCGCDISNSTVQTINNKQEAKAVIDSIFNSTVLNKLVSDYTLKVDQLNKGPTLDFIWIIIAIIIAGTIIFYIMIKSGTGILKAVLGSTAFFVVGGIILGIVLFLNKDTTAEDEIKKKEECRKPELGCGSLFNSETCDSLPGCEFNEELSVCVDKPEGVCETIIKDEVVNVVVNEEDNSEGFKSNYGRFNRRRY